MTTTPFTATLASEWTKLRSLRATWVTLGVGVGLGVAITALLSIVTGATWDEWNATDRAEFEPTLVSLGGTFFSSIALTLLGVSAAASEYSSGMMRLTLTATPRRGRVLAAKVLVVSGVTLVAGAIAVLATFVVGQAIMGSYGLDTAAFGDSGVPRVLVGSAVLTPVLPAIAIALAVMLRSKAGAITAVLALVFAPLVFGGLLPSSWQEDVLIYLPGAAGDGIAIAPLDEGGSYLAPGVAVVVVAAWLAAFLGVASVALTRRDA